MYDGREEVTAPMQERRNFEEEFTRATWYMTSEDVFLIQKGLDPKKASSNSAEVRNARRVWQELRDLRIHCPHLFSSSLL